ncbi:uncharacterized protein LOC111395200 [Olea europaea var. sylvestris]|uniref:uncharacterized protein LOC111395200 n=1 Tax=Olea europaea var. sylvestris TaxID=158386 RepID=UPI000C1D3759|nr:uncharacterized protein LOC111395200 [Olea europaea var. sylvestris]
MADNQNQPQNQCNQLWYIFPLGNLISTSDQMSSILISQEEISVDAFQMRLFSHTLKDAAREWFLYLPPGSIQSWNDMRDLESYPEAWERFKNFFRRCPSLDIPKQAQQYLFYYGLKQEFGNMIDASAGRSVMKLDVDEARDLYERIAENQSMWPADRKAPRKIAWVHNVDAVTVLAAQMEVLTMKMDNLYKSVNIVHQLPPVCEGCRGDHATIRCPLASTHVSIKNLEQQMGQIATTIANRPSAPIIELPSFTPANLVKAYVPSIPFSRRLRRQPTVQQVQAITTRSGVQLPEITVEKKGTVENQVPTTTEELVEQSKEAIENDQKIVSNSSQLKANVLGTTLTPPVPFPQRLQKANLEKQAMKFLEVLKKL